MLRSLLAATAALIALAAAPGALAQDRPISADVSVGGSYNSVDDGSDFYGVDVKAKAANDLSVFFPNSPLEYQVDGEYTFNTGQNDIESNTFRGALHLSTRRENFQFGGFGAIFNVDPEEGDSATGYGGGLNLNLFFPAHTVNLNGGYFTVDEDDVGGDFEAWNANLTGRQYITDNFLIHAGFGYTDSEFDPEDAALADLDGETWNVEIGSEYRLANRPFGVRGSVAYSDGDFGNADIERVTAKVAAVFHLNTTSLKSRDQEVGPSLPVFYPDDAALAAVASVADDIPELEEEILIFTE